MTPRECARQAPSVRAVPSPAKQRKIHPHARCANQLGAGGVAIYTNSAFFAEHDPLFLQLADTTERVFAANPHAAPIKLRQLGEPLAPAVAAPWFDPSNSFSCDPPP